MSVASTSSLSETTTELFRLWCRSCWLEEEGDLQAAASSFFSSLVGSTEIKLQGGKVLQTKGSHEQALAVLIQTMSPIWSNNKAAEDEQSTEDDKSIQKEVSGLRARQRALMCLAGALEGCAMACLSVGLVRTLGNFLTQVAGPVQNDEEIDEDPNSDLDEQLRDSALTTMQVLLRCPMPDDASAGSERLAMAQAAVQRRCAVADFADDEPRMGRVRSGLATLPRSRRSICFSLLEAPLDASSATTTTSKELTDTASTCVQFAASCLHGESDPRCLQQILKLLHRLQQKLGPFFTDDAVFPASEVFDAVAPYYPIQFTPPPNDVHGITREGLTRALWNVLSYTENDQVLVSNGFDTMLSLSLGLFLDTLNPPPEDGPPPVKEQVEAVECIYSLLLDLDLSSAQDAKTIGKTDRIILLEPVSLRQVLDTVWAIHGEASRKMDSDTIHRSVAHKCRTLVSQLALVVEQASNTKVNSDGALFDIMVTQRLQNLSDQSPNDLAYLACLASSGGVRCLQACLDTGLGPRVEKLDDDPAKIPERCDSIAAIIAACKAGCDRMKQRGVTVSPHPLEPYAPRCFSVLHSILIQSPPTGAVRAVESLLSAAPSQIWEGDLLLAPITDIMDVLLKAIVQDPSAMDVEEDEKWNECCMQAVAHFFSLAEAEDSQSVLSNETIRLAMKDMLIRMIDSCAVGSSGRRYDRECLALACIASASISKHVTSGLLHRLVKSLSNEGSGAAALVESLAAVVQQGGINASRELQQISEKPTLLDFIQELSKTNGDDIPGLEGVFGVSTLHLPPTDEQSSGLEAKVSGLYKLIVPIIPHYSKVVVPSHRRDLLTAMEKVLPPLNDADIIKLSLLLPFVSRAIQNPIELAPDEESSWKTARSYLADFSLGHEPFQARRFAAEALHGILAHVECEAEKCPILPLIMEVVLPTLKSSIEEIAKRSKVKKNTEKEMNKLVEMIAFVGLLGSAATTRGSSSAQTSSRISDFLIDLATKSTASFGDKEFAKTIALPPNQNPSFLTLVAADAFGSMILTSNKSVSGQRLRYFAIKRFQESVLSINSLSTISPGMVLIASHMICAVDLKTQNTETVKLLLEVMLGGLKMVGSEGFDFPSSAKKVSLAAIVKVQTVTPDVVEPFLYPLVTGVLRAYATTAKSDLPEEVIAFKVLALQVLEAAATHSSNNKDAFARLKQAVIAILGATLNEKSSILRHASVEVLNAWHTIQ